MVGTYNGWLVVLSVVVAIVASYVSLELALRVASLGGRRAGRYWIAGGAAAIGSGIWSMHFIGMLAYRLPIEVVYDLPLTSASLVLPIVVAGIGLREGARATQRLSRLLAGGLLIGAGIVSMHYVGMAAMKMQPPIRYEPALFTLSIVIAALASTAGLWSAFQLRMDNVPHALWKRVGSACVTGSGIAGMHYTGMAAAIFAPGSVCAATGEALDPASLAFTVGGFALAFEATTLFISTLHAYHADRAVRSAGHRLVEMQELERRDLARELHDRVGQNLTAIGINLEIMKSLAPGAGELSARLDDSIRLVESTVDATRNVMMELRPPMLDEHGLVSALQWLAMQFSQRTGIDAAVLGAEPAVRPRPEVEIALFRIAQEALNNVVKHARAQHVELIYEKSHGECILSVIDDGAGMDASRLGEAQGHGIVTMMERAQGVGGDLEISAVAGDGTQVKVRVPC